MPGELSEPPSTGFMVLQFPNRIILIVMQIVMGMTGESDDISRGCTSPRTSDYDLLVHIHINPVSVIF